MIASDTTVCDFTTHQAVAGLGALQAVAKLAGFVAVPSAPLPGVKSLWPGFRKLHDRVAGYFLARQPNPSASP